MKNKATQAAPAPRQGRIVDYIEPKPRIRVCQVRVRGDLYEKVNTVRKERGVSWPVFFEACFRRYLDEIRR